MNKETLAFFALLFTMMSISGSPHPYMLIIAYLIHELGHLFFAFLVGAKIEKFKLSTLHLSLSYDCSKITYGKEILVCLGGIIFNLITAGIIWLIPAFCGEACQFFVICNLSLALMNLYPVSILDGAGALKALMLIKLRQDLAEKISNTVSIIAVFVMWLLSIYLQLAFSSNLSLFFISVLLLIELCFSFKNI